jgi:hypothetical protein
MRPGAQNLAAADMSTLCLLAVGTVFDKQRILIAVLIAAALGAVATDLLNKAPGTSLNTHQVVLSFLTEAVFLAGTYFLLDYFIGTREGRKWADAAATPVLRTVQGALEAVVDLGAAFVSREERGPGTTTVQVARLALQASRVAPWPEGDEAQRANDRAEASFYSFTKDMERNRDFFLASSDLAELYGSLGRCREHFGESLIYFREGCGLPGSVDQTGKERFWIEYERLINAAEELQVRHRRWRKNMKIWVRPGSGFFD